MHYVCPACNSENKLDFTFPVEEYVCSHCSHLIDVANNRRSKLLKIPTENVVLDVGQKGKIEGREYTVVAIMVRKYGVDVFWREYYLKDDKGSDAFLSESDGHWVFLTSMSPDSFKVKDKVATYLDRNFRWYETTPCTIHAAAGFFEDKLNFSIATYREYVNGTQMISEEESGGRSGSNKGGIKNYFYGSHISKYKIKRAFKLSHMPHYSGIGIVQPYYLNVKQAVNVLCIAALLMCLFQLYVYISRTNETVIEQSINFADVRDKELVSKSFTLSGGSAPMNVKVFSNVDNSWANVQLSLVNEGTNEIAYTSKDIEQYHGFEDGEKWSEGSQSEDFNLCGVSAGKYHFVISAENEGSHPSLTGYVSPDSKVSISRDKDGIVDIKSYDNGLSTSFTSGEDLDKDSSEITKLARKSFGTQKLDSLINAEAIRLSTDPISSNNSVEIKAAWLPVSFWNLMFLLILMIVVYILIYIGRYYFNINKWKNSSNSPYQA